MYYSTSHYYYYHQLAMPSTTGTSVYCSSELLALPTGRVEHALFVRPTGPPCPD